MNILIAIICSSNISLDYIEFSLRVKSSYHSNLFVRVADSNCYLVGTENKYFSLPNYYNVPSINFIFMLVEYNFISSSTEANTSDKLTCGISKMSISS